jgi:two-component system chemotaxis sensor kinase CheA
MARPVFPGEPRHRLTIQTKLSGLIVALVAAIVVPVAVFRTAGTLRDRMAQAERSAWLYATVTAEQLGPALAARDGQGATRVLRSLSVDSDVAGAALYTDAGEKLASSGALAHANRMARVEVPVTGPGGARGTLVLELSVDAAAREQTEALREGIIAGGGALGLGLLAAWLIGRSFARRVRVVSDQALAVAAGDLARRPLQDDSSDEIGQMARAFKAMVDRIRALIQQIKESAKEEAVRLERLVAQRTEELDQRNADMRLVLDNVDQGFVTLNRAGRVSQDCSRVVETWLGPPTPRIPFGDWMFQGDPEQLALFELGWEALLEGVLPRALLLDQLPRRVTIRGRVLDLSYRTIDSDSDGRSHRDGDTDADAAFDHLLVVITDVTAELAGARAEQAQRELASVMQRYQRDRTSAVTFYAESQASCRRIADGTLAGEDLLRALHTLKGNARLMGLDSFSSLCHELESALAEEGALSDGGRARLKAAWADVEHRLGFLLGATDKIEIAESELAAVIRAAAGETSRPDLVRMLEACRADSIAMRLEHFGDQARRLAESLDKLPVEVSVEAGGLRAPRGALDEFWAAFVHVIRNAVDHGLETAEERAASQKPATRRVELHGRLEGESFVVEVEDDGRGIDWEAIRTRARAAKLPCSTKSELLYALCADGLSTKDDASELSGRGVGMAAVRAAASRSGGVLEVISEPGQGTLMRFRWPAKRLGIIDARPAKPAAPPRLPRATAASR